MIFHEDGALKKFFSRVSLNDKEHYFYAYTLLFLVLSSFSFFWIWSDGKCLLMLGDGMHQHYPFLIYWGQMLRRIFMNFISGNFGIPLYDFNIGYGADIITSLHYNVIGDPLNLLSFFVPMKFSEELYDFLTVFRIYLAGLAFSFFYCSVAKKDNWGFSALIGSVVYVFSAYPLISVFAPFFINQMIYLPLLLMGAERILDGKTPYFFIIMTSIALISNFYFFYPTTFLTAFFILVRMFFKKILFKDLKLIIRLFFYYFTGVLTACFIFIPNLIALLQSQRFGVSHPFDLFYAFDMYKQALLAFISIHYPFTIPTVPLHFEATGFPLISLFAIIAVFVKRKKFYELKTSFIILTLIALLPFGGYLLNGFSYVSNRWMYGYTFLTALITAVAISDFKFISKKYVKLIIFLFTVINAAFNAYQLYEKKDYKREFMEKGTPYLTETDNYLKIIKSLDDKSFFRVEGIQYYNFIEIRNLSLLMGVKTDGFFYSLINPRVSRFNNEIELYNHQEHEVKNLDSRTIAGTLANVKYFILPSNGE
ncbi:MAG: YfhO family protein, partial [Endomicrobium sp.]|nr:YfhO family protein [Endomicrobium sp.]